MLLKHFRSRCTELLKLLHSLLAPRAQWNCPLWTTRHAIATRHHRTRRRRRHKWRGERRGWRCHRIEENFFKVHPPSAKHRIRRPRQSIVMHVFIGMNIVIGTTASITNDIGSRRLPSLRPMLPPLSLLVYPPLRNGNGWRIPIISPCPRLTLSDARQLRGWSHRHESGLRKFTWQATARRRSRCRGWIARQD